MSDVRTEPVKYVFLDIVGFTTGRSVEAQSDLVATLNGIARKALDTLKVKDDQLILLPTGDGICIAIISDRRDPYDLHLRIALEILKGVQDANTDELDATRQFSLRVGLNENVDNIVVDINGRQNVAGAGVNMAQRIMSQADGNQIIVGQSVYDTLHVREAHMESFRSFTATVKHGARVSVHQYIGDFEGLNTNIPKIFVPPSTPPKKPAALTKFAAYYMALALKHREFWLQMKDRTGWEYTAGTLLYFLTLDHMGKAETSEFDTWRPRTWGAPQKSLEEQYEHYDRIDFWVLITVTQFVYETELHLFRACFEGSSIEAHIFVNQNGRQMLEAEWPDVLKDVEANQSEPS